MPIPFNCPACGKHMNVDDAYAGQSGPCSGCGQTITIPRPGFSPPPPKAIDPLQAGPSSLGPMGGYGGATSYGPPPAKAGSSGCAMAVVVAAIAGAVLLACGGIGLALLLPAVNAARQAAVRTQSSNNLKQIAIALHGYHDAYKRFPPPVTYDANGKPLYSWRVNILPFLEQPALYQQFDKDKAWDDPANVNLSSMMVNVYRAADDAPGSCSYVAVAGGNTFWKDTGCTMADITDGTSNTIAVVETANNMQSWAAPDTLALDAPGGLLGPVPGKLPGATGKRGFNVAMGDGSIKFVPETIDPTMLRALLTRNGGEVVQDW